MSDETKFTAGYERAVGVYIDKRKPISRDWRPAYTPEYLAGYDAGIAMTKVKAKNEVRFSWMLMAEEAFKNYAARS